LKLTFDTLRKHLSGEPARAYLVTGDEALLVGEAADAIRAAAKRAGFEEREVFFIERVGDWEAVRAATNNLSLFGSRKLIEIRLPSGKASVTYMRWPAIDSNDSSALSPPLVARTPFHRTEGGHFHFVEEGNSWKS